MTSSDKRTLYEFKNLVHRPAVGANPSKNMKAFKDILLAMISGYIVVAANAQSSKNINHIELTKIIVPKWVKIIVYYPPVANDNSSATAPEASAVPVNTMSAVTMNG